MNKRIKEVIIAIQNGKIVYAHTNINAFHKSMKLLEPRIPSKETLKKHLDSKGVYFFTNEFGALTHFCKYDNPNYVGLKY